MHLSRRDFLKLAGAVGVASTIPMATLQKALAGTGDPRVIWLQGQSCSGCSVSLMNAVSSSTCPNCTTVDTLLTDVINLEYHSTLIAAAGELALSGAFGPHPSLNELCALGDNWLATGENKMDLSGPAGVKDGTVNLIDFAALCNQGYILVVEGSIPMGSDGKFCDIGGHTTMKDAFNILGSNANMIIAVGSCACFSGIPGALPKATSLNPAGSNPTGAVSVQSAMTTMGITKTLVNIPGCPMHPEWFVGTVIKVLAGESVTLDSNKRPTAFFGQRVHNQCEFREFGGNHPPEASALGDYGCLEEQGCRGESTWADCPVIKWNAPAGGTGVNWCVGSRIPCYGCTESTYPGANDLVSIDGDD
jgi:hydrogenase small subunit